MVNLEGIATELYGLPPEQFTRSRNVRAAELAAAGDRELAAAVRKLARPSLSAWLANVLVRDYPNDVGELLELGPGLRRSQELGGRDEMRRLSARRQALIRHLVALASDQAKSAGHSLAAQTQRQLEGTLEAAVAEPSAAEELRAGRLAEALSHVGFGEVTSLARGPRQGAPGRQPEVETGSEPRRSKSTTRAGPARRNAMAEADRSLAQAEGALRAAEGFVDGARRRQELASARRRDVAKDLRDADRELAQATSALQTARDTRRREQQKVKQADRERRRAADPSNPG